MAPSPVVCRLELVRRCFMGSAAVGWYSIAGIGGVQE